MCQYFTGQENSSLISQTSHPCTWEKVDCIITQKTKLVCVQDIVVWNTFNEHNYLLCGDSREWDLDINLHDNFSCKKHLTVVIAILNISNYSVTYSITVVLNMRKN